MLDSLLLYRAQSGMTDVHVRLFNTPKVVLAKHRLLVYHSIKKAGQASRFHISSCRELALVGSLVLTQALRFTQYATIAFLGTGELGTPLTVAALSYRRYDFGLVAFVGNSSG